MRSKRSRLPESNESSILTYVEVIALSTNEMLEAMQESQSRGVRGAAIFDYLHLAAARKAKADRFYTLNYTDFRAIHRPGDPEIVQP